MKALPLTKYTPTYLYWDGHCNEQRQHLQGQGQLQNWLRWQTAEQFCPSRATVWNK